VSACSNGAIAMECISILSIYVPNIYENGQSFRKIVGPGETADIWLNAWVVILRIIVTLLDGFLKNSKMGSQHVLVHKMSLASFFADVISVLSD